MLKEFESWPVRNRPTRIETLDFAMPWNDVVRVLPKLVSLRILACAVALDWTENEAKWATAWAKNLVELQLVDPVRSYTASKPLVDVAHRFNLAAMTQLRILQLDRSATIAECVDLLGHLNELVTLSIGILWDEKPPTPDDWKRLNAAWPKLENVDWVQWNSSLDPEETPYMADHIHIDPMIQFDQAHERLKSMRWHVDLGHNIGEIEMDEIEQAIVEAQLLASLPLTHLRISRAHQADLVFIVKARPQMEQLVVERSWYIGDAFFDAFVLPAVPETKATDVPSVSKRPLRLLRLFECDNTLASTDSMKRFASACPDLRALVMANPQHSIGLSPDGIRHWLTAWSSLEVLEIQASRQFFVSKGLVSVIRNWGEGVASSNRALLYRFGKASQLRNFDKDTDDEELSTSRVMNMLFDLWL
jgi:hypothetical protein